MKYAILLILPSPESRVSRRSDTLHNQSIFDKVMKELNPLKIKNLIMQVIHE